MKVPSDGTDCDNWGAVSGNGSLSAKRNGSWRDITMALHQPRSKISDWYRDLLMISEYWNDDIDYISYQVY